MVNYLVIGADLSKRYWKAVLDLMERFSITQLALPIEPKYQGEFDSMTAGSSTVDDLAVLRVLEYDGAQVDELKTLIARAVERGITFWCIGDDSEEMVQVMGERLVSITGHVALLVTQDIAAKRQVGEQLPLGALLPDVETVCVQILVDAVPTQPLGTLLKAEQDFDYHYYA